MFPVAADLQARAIKFNKDLPKKQVGCATAGKARRGNTLGPLHLGQSSGDLARDRPVARSEGDRTLFGSAFCRAVFRPRAPTAPTFAPCRSEWIEPGRYARDQPSGGIRRHVPGIRWR